MAGALSGTFSSEDTRACDNGWRGRLTYWQVTLRSDRSSGRIFHSLCRPGSHHSQVRCQHIMNVLVSIIAFLGRIILTPTEGVNVLML